MVTILFLVLVGIIMVDDYRNLPIELSEECSYEGEIIDVRFVERTVGFLSTTPSKTVVRFKDGEYLTFHNKLHYGIHEAQNATINYSVNKYGKMFFDSVIYGNN